MRWFFSSIRIREKLRNARIKRIFFVTVFILFVIYCYIWVINGDIELPFLTIFTGELLNGSRGDTLLAMKKTIEEKSNRLACKHPVLPVFSPDVMAFIRNEGPINCSDVPQNWVTCKMSNCSIRKSLINKYGKEIYCNFTDIIRISDFATKDGQKTSFVQSYILKKSDYVDISCVVNNYKSGQWKIVLPGIRKDNEILNRTGWGYVPENSLNLSILMVGFDSMSRNNFQRKLPQSYDFLVNDLKAVILEGYNIVGDGTPQAIIPILTGKTEFELPETRKRKWGSHFVNVYPFAWNDFRKNGYVTGYFEDLPMEAIFTYRLKGFNEQPTDHYLRTYYLEAAKRHKSKPFCEGSLPRHRVLFDHIRNFMKSYKYRPKFLFSFHGELSHNHYNKIQAADLDLRNLLNDLQKSYMLEDTILILMADHGHRFASVRATLQGKLEERMPMFAFVMPKKFKEKNPKMYKTLVENGNRLVTPFDIHATFMSILKPPINDGYDFSTDNRSQSLFTPISPNRTCADAFIEPHWCACLSFTELPIDHAQSYSVATSLVKKLNLITQKHRNICHLWSLSSINSFIELKPNEKLVNFKQNADLDGYVPNMKGQTNILIHIYQIQVKLNPGGALFEASVSFNTKNQKYYVNEGEISRINVYGNQAKCVEKNLHDLRKYCYCKNT